MWWELFWDYLKLGAASNNRKGLCDQLRLERSRLLLVDDRQWDGQTRAATIEFVTAFPEFQWSCGCSCGTKDQEGANMRCKSNSWERQTAKSGGRRVNDAMGAEECIVS